MKSIKNRSEVVVDEILMRQIAGIAITGATYTKISDQLNLPRVLVRRVMQDKKFQEMVRSAGENELVPVITRAKARLSKLVDKAIDVLERHLDQDNLNAARMVFEATGLNKEKEAQQDTNITVILPGQKVERSINISEEGRIERDDV